MKQMCVILSSALVIQCSHGRWKPSEVPLGQSKSTVVEKLGSPDRSWRYQGKDHWYYNASPEQESEKLILVFENGVLTEKLQPGASDKEFEELEEELKKMKSDKTPGKFETLSE